MTTYLRYWMACALLGASGVGLAGPAEEVAELSAPRLEHLERGDVAAYTAAFADNAVFHSALSPFRIEGKAAIRAQFAQLFQVYPKRKALIRQPAVRVYGDDLVIQNAYAVLYLTDSGGKVRVVPSRSSTVWSKAGGSWQIVEQHISQMPDME